MNQIIRDVSSHFIQLLPEEQQSFSADDLKALGIPGFIVDRILCDLSESLQKDLNISKSEWIDDQQAPVQRAMRDFVSLIQPFTRMPRQRAAEIIDNAVIDVVDMLSRPRSRTIEVLFEMDPLISINTLRRRSERITVNQYLTVALIRYMDRKKWTDISKSDAERVLKVVDDRYVEGFSPLAWAHSLDLLFQLSGNKVEKELIVDFFIDKQRDDLAALFESDNDFVNRSKFIECIALGPAPEKSRASNPDDTSEEESALEEEPLTTQTSAFIPDTEQELEPEPEPELEPELESEPEPEQVLEKSSTPTIPIWQQFLEDVDEEVTEPVESETILPVSKPSDTQTTTGPAISLGQQKIALVEWLKPEESDYVDSIFLGNELMYFRSLGSIEALSDWSEAQLFIKESIIELMDLDYQDPVLIQFIDQIQSYFSPSDL
jgi:hypothetical protein